MPSCLRGAVFLRHSVLVLQSLPAVQKENLKNPRPRTAAILKIVKCDLSNRLTNFDKIWYRDAY